MQVWICQADAYRQTNHCHMQVFELIFGFFSRNIFVSTISSNFIIFDFLDLQKGFELGVVLNIFNTKVWKEGGSCTCHASGEGVQPAHPLQVPNSTYLLKL